MFNKKEIKINADSEMKMVEATLAGGCGIGLILLIATGAITSTGGIILVGAAAGFLLAAMSYFIFCLFEELLNDQPMDSNFSAQLN